MGTMAFASSVLFFVLVAAAAHAAVSPRDYWRSVLPDTPMPAAIRDLLPPAYTGVGVKEIGTDGLATPDVTRARMINFNQKGVNMGGLAATNIDKARLSNFYQKGVGVEGLATIDIGKARVSNTYQKGLSLDKLVTTVTSRTRISNFKQKGVGVEDLATTNVGKARISNLYQKGVAVDGLVATDFDRASISNIFQKGISVDCLATINVVKARISNFYHKGVGTEGLTANTHMGQAMISKFNRKGLPLEERPTPIKQTLAIADTANYFLEKDLFPYTKMRLDFSRISPAKPFISREETRYIPFSLKKLSLILDNFSVKPSSVEAKITKMTLQDCDGEDSTGETRFCATSLESMVDFATSIFGSHDVVAISSDVNKEGMPREHEYTVTTTHIQRLPGEHTVTCHQQPYPYAVFYCHVTWATTAYVVPLIRKEDGAMVDAVAVCHSNTSTWSPSHLAFQALKVAPGTLPICHFLPQDSVVWAPKEEVLPTVFDD